MSDMMIGVDLAKRVFQVHGASMTGQVIFRKKMTREQFQKFMAQHPACIVVFEACGSASYWARAMEALDHTPRQSKLLASRAATKEVDTMVMAWRVGRSGFGQTRRSGRSASRRLRRVLRLPRWRGDTR